MKKTVRAGVVMLLLGAVWMLSFEGCGRKKESIPVSSDSVSVPVQELTDAILHSYDGPHKRWMLESKFLRKPLADTGTMFVNPVRLTIYDSMGEPETRVWSDSGSTSVRMDVMVVWGNVLIKTKTGKVVRSQKLWWNRDRRRVESDDYVQVETEKGDMLRGKGLDAVEDFSRFTFKQNARIRIPDFKRRMEQDEEEIF